MSLRIDTADTLKPLSRQLAAIVHADVIGSTTLVQQAETIAHQRIQSEFQHNGI